MEIARQALSVLLVFVLLGFAVWRLRRPGSLSLSRPAWIGLAATSKSLEAVERIALTPQHALHLVRIDNRLVVMATHPQGCALLAEVPKGAGA